MNTIMGGGAILLAVLIVLTVVFGWPKEIHYVWAGLAFLWGVLAFVRK